MSDNEDDKNRIAKTSRTVTWEESATVTVCYRRCDGCNLETPEPADSVIVAFANHGGNRRYLWPFDDSFSSRWQWAPPGWTQGEGTPGAIHCPECTQAIRAAVSEALKYRPRVAK